MMRTAYLKPAPGLTVRDPVDLTPLPADGAEKPLDTYWRRRLRDGDVVEAPAPRPSRRRDPATAGSSPAED